MTVSNVSSTLTPYQPVVQSPWQQRAQDFKALQSALQSGDLSGAQQAFAALQNNQQTSTQAANPSGASSPTSQLATDFQSLQTALQAGNLSGAQTAFAAVKQDMQSAGGAQRAHHHHHHHGGSGGTNSTPASSASSTTNSAGATLNALLNLQA